ncbi:MAG: choice-of-anchor D domain-containing protein, partial [Candidatus Kapaibacterium sp.]
ITALAQNPLRVLSPNGGENLAAGSLDSIRWTGLIDEDSTRVNVEYSIDNGASWKSLRTNYSGDVISWGIPDANSNRCCVRVVQVAGRWRIADSAQVLHVSGSVRGTAIAYSRDGSLLLRSDGNVTEVLDAATGDLVRRLDLGAGLISGRFLDPTNRRLAVGIFPKDTLVARVEIWNINTGRSDVRFAVPRPSAPEYAFYSDLINSIAFSNDGRLLVVSAKFSVTIWDIAAKRLIDSIGPIQQFTAPYTYAHLAFAPGDSLIYMTDAGGTIKAWSIPQHAFVKSIPGTFLSGEFSNDCRTFIGNTTVGGNTQLYTYDLDSARNTFLYVHSGTFAGSLTHDNRYLIYRNTGDSVIRVMDMATRHAWGELSLPLASMLAFIANPAGDRIVTLMKDDRRIVLWRHENADISDAPFTITNNTPFIARTDMGRAIVGRGVDTTITALIRNIGAAAMTVDVVHIAAGDTTDFAVVSGGGPATIPVGGAHAVTIRFRPAARGERTAWIEAQTSNGTLTGELAGFGLQGVLSPIVEKIDFGVVALNTPNEQEATILYNTGDGDIRLDSVALIDPARTLFEVVDVGGIPRELRRGDSLRMRVRFRSAVAGTYRARLVTWDEYGRVSYTDLVGDAGGQMAAPESPVIAGERNMHLSVAPNPTRGHAIVSVVLPSTGPIRLLLYDAVGRIKLARDLGVQDAGASLHDIDIEGMPPGVYFLQALGAQSRVASMVVVQP